MDARVRDGRLHDARHTAATVPMLLGVPARVMGWEPGTSARMRARYLHVPDAMLKDVAKKIADAIWDPRPSLWTKTRTTRAEERLMGPTASSGAHRRRAW